MDILNYFHYKIYAMLAFVFFAVKLFLIFKKNFFSIFSGVVHVGMCITQVIKLSQNSIAATLCFEVVDASKLASIVYSARYIPNSYLRQVSL